MARRHLLSVAALLAASSMAAPAAAQPAYGPSQFQIGPLISLARELGRAAGNAEFCAFEEELVEDFIVRALARLSREAGDEILLAGGRVEFNSHAAFGRARGPEESCETYAIAFARYRSALGNTGGAAPQGGDPR